MEFFDAIPLTLAHYSAGGVYAKEHVIPAGMSVDQHSHDHDHLSILARGEVVVTVAGEQRVITAPACLNIPAGKEHHILALTNCTWFCIWNEAVAESTGMATKGD